MYWTRKTRPDMKMAADLKAMHKPKPRTVPVYSKVDGVTTVVGSKVEIDRIPARDLHRIAMGRQS